MTVRSMKGTKVICAAMCMICMVFMFCAGAVVVQAHNTAKITTSSCSVENGTTAKVSFELSDNPGIWGMKFRVSYNHDVMTLSSVNIGDVFSENEVTLPESLDRQKFVFCASGDQLADITANGTLMSLNFAVKEDVAEGEYPVTVELVQAIDVDGKDVSVNVSDGNVMITDSLHANTEGNVTDSKVDNTDSEKSDAGADTSDTSLWGTVFMVLIVLGCAVSVVGFFNYKQNGRRTK